MLCKIKTIKTKMHFVDKGSIDIPEPHFGPPIDIKFKQNIDKFKAKNIEAVDKILDKTYK